MNGRPITQPCFTLLQNLIYVPATQSPETGRLFCFKNFVLECYRFSRALPQDERFAMTSQIRRTALSVHLNIAEGASRKSEAERKRFYEIARGSMVEIDAALDIADGLDYFQTYDTINLSTAMVTCFKILSGML